MHGKVRKIYKVPEVGAFSDHGLLGRDLRFGEFSDDVL